MRTFIYGILMVAGLMLAGVSTASAGAPGAPDLSGTAVTGGIVHKASYCERLRRACEYKNERGEEGQGNCRRYREECGRESQCERLRRACEHKSERGEEGQGNCRRYREECGRGRY
jgi:hypothetical protein